MQRTASAKMAECAIEDVKAMAEYEGKTVSMLIKDALRGYAVNSCALILAGLDAGVLSKVETQALDKLRVYRDLASRFGG
jgi:hypothetical protein